MPKKKRVTKDKGPQRWVYKFLMDGGLVIKKTGREAIRDAQGTLLDSYVTPPIKVNIVAGILVVNKALGKRHGVEPAAIAKMLEAKPGYKRSFWCIERPGKTLTKQESEDIETMIAAKDAIPTGPKVVRGARSLG